MRSPAGHEPTAALRTSGGQPNAEADWHQYKMEERIVEILNSVADHARPGKYSLTVYQIAIEFAQRFELDFVKMDRPVGGSGAGKRALTIYMANQLSKRIKAGKTPQIEMLFLHPADTQSFFCKYKNQQIVTTTPAAGYPIPVYRLRAET